MATEALRGEGAILVNMHGERFMRDVHPDAELAPRDVVAREIFAQWQAGNRPMLDTRAALGDTVNTQFPAVAEACARNGLNPAHDLIPVAAAAHYHMGGVATDIDGRSTLANLWVCGEASSTGLHGANRLASNGLLEALVYARICALGISKTLAAPLGTAPLDIVFTGVGPVADAQAVADLRQTMTEYVGVVRDAAGLTTALRRISDLEQANASCESFLNMTATATLIAACALVREESRGAHERSDFPDVSAGPAKRSRMTLAQALRIRNDITKDAR